MNEKKTFKEWFDEKQGMAKWKLHNAVEWCRDHKEVIVVFGPVLIGSVAEMAKILTKKQTINEEKALKDRYIYDSSTRHYYELKRKPKNSEWLQIDQRVTNGEMLGWVLNDMKLLK